MKTLINHAEFSLFALVGYFSRYREYVILALAIFFFASQPTKKVVTVSKETHFGIVPNLVAARAASSISNKKIAEMKPKPATTSVSLVSKKENPQSRSDKKTGKSSLKSTSEIFDVVVWHIKYHEGYRPTPYLCPAGYLTVGYGYRITDPENWHIDTLKERSASNLLHESITKKYQWVCTSLMPSSKGWSRNEQMAVAMLAYNCKMGNFKNSRLWYYINKYKQNPTKEYRDKLHHAWLRWSYYKTPSGKTKQSKGLKERREFEYNLFVNGEEWIDENRSAVRQRLIAKMQTSKWYQYSK